jgi:hypothetical protein
MYTSICTYTFQVVVFPSAYPAAFPRAFASETILLAISMRLTPSSMMLKSRWPVMTFLIFVWR